MGFICAMREKWRIGGSGGIWDQPGAALIKNTQDQSHICALRAVHWLFGANKRKRSSAKNVWNCCKAKILLCFLSFFAIVVYFAQTFTLVCCEVRGILFPVMIQTHRVHVCLLCGHTNTLLRKYSCHSNTPSDCHSLSGGIGFPLQSSTILQKLDSLVCSLSGLRGILLFFLMLFHWWSNIHHVNMDREDS